MNRRGFMGAILAAGAAPAIVRASSLMPIFVPKIWTPGPYDVTVEIRPMTGTEILKMQEEFLSGLGYWRMTPCG